MGLVRVGGFWWRKGRLMAENERLEDFFSKGFVELLSCFIVLSNLGLLSNSFT